MVEESLLFFFMSKKIIFFYNYDNFIYNQDLLQLEDGF